MDRLIIASVQQQMRVFATVADYRMELQRFLRIAQHKHASLAVFPELGGTMLVPPMLRDSRTTLLKYAELGRRRKAPPWRRYAGQISWWLASRSSTTFATTVVATIDVAGQELWEAYCDLYSGLAKEFNLVLVAPSAYLPDPADGVVRNITAVFGRDGSLLGYQAKVMLHPQDKPIVEAGADWDVIHTDVGAIGLLLGSDVLYPEIGRLLAYKGAEVLICQGACASTVMYQKLRAGILARMQDNQLFAAASFLVGRNDLNGSNKLVYAGRSAIFAPQELTPRFNGVLVEMGSPSSEGVLSADWNFVALRKLWEISDTPLRREVPIKQIGRVIASLYARLQQAPDLLDDLGENLTRLLLSVG
ncbi:MAG: nitrilase-related carbon-nitrogen hydrolase [Caldilineaceae bacterium]